MTAERRPKIVQLYQVLSDICHALSRITSEDQLLQRICEITLALDGIRSVAIFFYEPAKNVLRCRAFAGEQAEQAAGLELSLDTAAPTGRTLVGESFRTGKALVSNDYPGDRQRAGLPEHSLAAGAAAACAVPLRRGDKLVG